jgi:hypothetical protein
MTSTQTGAGIGPPGNANGQHAALAAHGIEVDEDITHRSGSVNIVDVEDIEETPENWEIYRNPENDPEFIKLCESIKANGILSPLELSSDLYVISGHRRLQAALLVGLDTVPAIIDDNVEIEPMSRKDRITLLTERNKGTRIKSDAERYLEAAAAIDPEQAVREAIARKAQVFTKVKSSDMHLVDIKGGIRRTDPTMARAEILRAVLGIIDNLRRQNFLPTGARNIHYLLLRTKVRTSSGKAGHIYGDRAGDAKLLNKLITDARSAGIIDPGDIDDGTRPTWAFEHDQSMPKYVLDTLDGLFGSFFSNVHAEQPNHVEILVEKNTIAPLIHNHVGQQFRLPVSSMRGYGSYPLSRDVAARFEASGKDQLIVVYVSDLDPEGVDMPASFKKYLAHDFDIDATVIRAAVTPQQVEQHDLPPDIDVKLSSSRAKSFIAQHGTKCWELDSMPPQILINEVSNVVKQCLDMDVFNAAMHAERETDIELARMKAAIGVFARDRFRDQLRGAA